MRKNTYQREQEEKMKREFGLLSLSFFHEVKKYKWKMDI